MIESSVHLKRGLVILFQKLLKILKNVYKCSKKVTISVKGAGFDGVELHSANGYLAHQFLDPNSNERTGDHGNDVKSCSRFALEAIDTLLKYFLLIELVSSYLLVVAITI
ncbi:hypothetical protein K502DRAFT_358597 [Neoconidiobolus thromboides FSU 785]|nr:hypothetical protein K502DRAFT_358597 [Neoconidiobolus thromboides FSU 785]